MDRRIQYTKKALCDSFLSLLEESPITEITVTEVCQKANVNRGTFYRHYLDIYDLYESICSEMLEEIVGQLSEIEPDIEIPHEPFYHVLDIIVKNKDIFFTIVKWKDNSSILEHLFVLFHDKFIDKISHNFKLENLKYADYCYQFIIGGSISVITNWIKSDYQDEQKNIADCLISVAQHGFSYYFK